MRWVTCVILIVFSVCSASPFTDNLNAAGLKTKTLSSPQIIIGDLVVSKASVLVNGLFRVKYAEATPKHGGVGSTYTVARIAYSISNNSLLDLVNNSVKFIFPDPKAPVVSDKNIFECNKMLEKNNIYSNSILWISESDSVLKVNCGVSSTSYFIDVIRYSKYINESITAETYKKLKGHIASYLTK